MNWYSVTCMRNKSVFFILGHFYLAFKTLWDSYIQTFPAEELSLVSIDKTSSLHISTRCALLALRPLMEPSLFCFSKEGLTFLHLLEWAWSSLQNLERRRPWTSDLPCFLPALGKAAAASTSSSHAAWCMWGRRSTNHTRGSEEDMKLLSSVILWVHITNIAQIPIDWKQHTFQSPVNFLL